MHRAVESMTLTRQIDRLEPMVLQPLHWVNGEAWHHAPDGKWTVAQIVAHLALSVDHVARAFDHREQKAPMRRRATPRQAASRLALLTVGRFPRGVKAPEAACPDDRPEPELVTAQLRMGVARFHALATDWPEHRQRTVFVKHPLLGDLNLPEWVRFHYIHCRHHSGQLRELMAWLWREQEALARQVPSTPPAAPRP